MTTEEIVRLIMDRINPIITEMNLKLAPIDEYDESVLEEMK